MFLVAQRLGKMLLFVQSHSFYLDLLAWAFCIGIVTFVIVSEVRSRKNTERPTATPSPMGSIPSSLLRAKDSRIGRTVGAVALGMLLQWAWQSYEVGAKLAQAQEMKAEADQEKQEVHVIYLREYAGWKHRQEEWQKTVDAWKTKEKMRNVSSELSTDR